MTGELGRREHQSMVRLRISGEVRRVGFRGWLQRQAEALSVDGWVRYRGAQVDVLLAGSAGAIEDLVARCTTGPRGARVESVTRPPLRGDEPLWTGFHQLPEF